MILKHILHLQLNTCKTNTMPILRHQIRISTNQVLGPRKLEIRNNIAKTVKEPKKQILCHETEPNPAKDRATCMHGDNH